MQALAQEVFVAEELRAIMASLGFRTVDEMVGRVDCVVSRPREDASTRALVGEFDQRYCPEDLLLLIDGDATLVTGGTVVGGRTTAPGQIRGSKIEGGRVQHLAIDDLGVDGAQATRSLLAPSSNR